MVDKLVTIRREKVGNTIGRLSDSELLELNRLLALVIGLA
jgi:mRNA-degrading endonuclease toxin of MazEF toxin-antitoxin module